MKAALDDSQDYSLYDPRNASAQQLANIEQARKIHPDWEVKVWQDPVEPAGFRLAKYWSKTNSGAQLADLIRLEVVHREGGFYLDSDFVAHRNLDPLRQYSFVVASEDGQSLTNAFFGGEQNSPVLEHLITELDTHEVDWKLSPEQTTGPALFTKLLKWRSDITVAPREAFYPYNWNSQAATTHPWTYGEHTWDSSWKPNWSLRNVFRTARQLVNACGRWLLARAKWLELQHARLSRHLRPWPYQASGVICVQTIHGFKLFLQGEDTSLTPHIAQAGCYEYDEEQFVKRVVQGGDWVIDVGANIGALSMLFAQRVGPFGRVFSYEPNPLCANLLKKSLVVNWMHERVVLRERGIGSQPARMVLNYGRTRLGDASLVSLEETGSLQKTLKLLGDGERVEVEVTTLDNDFPVDLPIRLLKIDVEGFEHHVLQGAARLLNNQCIDLIMLECEREVYGANWPAFEQELQRLVERGYAPAVVTRRSKLRRITLQRALAGAEGRELVFRFAACAAQAVFNGSSLGCGVAF